MTQQTQFGLQPDASTDTVELRSGVVTIRQAMPQQNGNVAQAAMASLSSTCPVSVDLDGGNTETASGMDTGVDQQSDAVIQLASEPESSGVAVSGTANATQDAMDTLLQTDAHAEVSVLSAVESAEVLASTHDSDTAMSTAVDEPTASSSEKFAPVATAPVDPSQMIASPPVSLLAALGNQSEAVAAKNNDDPGSVPATTAGPEAGLNPGTAITATQGSSTGTSNATAGVLELNYTAQGKMDPKTGNAPETAESSNAQALVGGASATVAAHTLSQHDIGTTTQPSSSSPHSEPATAHTQNEKPHAPSQLQTREQDNSVQSRDTPRTAVPTQADAAASKPGQPHINPVPAEPAHALEIRPTPAQPTPVQSITVQSTLVQPTAAQPTTAPPVLQESIGVSSRPSVKPAVSVVHTNQAGPAPVNTAPALYTSLGRHEVSAHPMAA